MVVIGMAYIVFVIALIVSTVYKYITAYEVISFVGIIT